MGRVNVNRINRLTARRCMRLSWRMRSALDPAERSRLAKILLGQLTGNTGGIIQGTATVSKDGGPGSGNWGHEGRPGEKGGSKGGGGVHNRQTTESGSYTSFSKTKKAAAKEHTTDAKELCSIPEGSLLQAKDGSKWVKTHDEYDGDYLYCDDTGDMYSLDDDYIAYAVQDLGEGVKISIPDSANPNYNVVRCTDNGPITAKQYEEMVSKSFNAETAQEYDDVYRQQSGAIYSSLDIDSKKALGSYTGGGYSSINTNLRSGETGSAIVNGKVDRITAAIDQSELQTDTVLYRECSKSAMEKLLRMGKGTLTKDTADTLVGKTGTDDAFMSTSSSKEGDFGGSVKMQILAPKGTKALYAEPFSVSGDGDGFNWDSVTNRDGKSTQSSFSIEDETILQRGTSISVVSGGYNHSSGQYEYKVIITGQDYEKSAYSKARSSK